jgi:hypothetical protein
MRTAAWCAVGAGVLAPLVRRRLHAPPVLVQGIAFAAPVGLCVATRRTRMRDVATCALQMWAYVAAYETPSDDPGRQLERAHVRYPIAVDRVLGAGELPTVRLQRALAQRGPDGPRWRALDRVLIWTHWLWFTVPHLALLYILLRRPERFTRAAVMTYAVFDIGACVYWLHPTAPPWFAAAQASAGLPPIAGAGGQVSAGAAPAGSPQQGWPRAQRGGARSPGGDGARAATGPREEAPAAAAPGGGCGWRAGADLEETLVVRRMMVEYGEGFWRSRWDGMYGALGGNPLAAMPSLHFATSAMATLVLAEAHPVAGAAGAAYSTALAFALVYLGEHYVADLIGGLALTAAVYRLGPRAQPVLECAGRTVARLEELAHGD